jgi:undecaprenyl-phosphate galactose phosphotransferase/putative colanic acid biosynthesis UDP-glucose lipid carrier transferase
MSVVGPRPHAVAHDDEYGSLIVDYVFRQHVKPGITMTGWVQINGYRGATAHIHQMKKRIDFDIWYINNWSLLLDIQILVKTILVVLRARTLSTASHILLSRTTCRVRSAMCCAACISRTRILGANL